MIGPITAIILFIVVGLGLSAWSILRRASRGESEGAPDSVGGDNHFTIGVEPQVELPGQGPA
jgi:hypothetical protein